MLTLNDGRSELWQWDTGRKLNVDADCSQVHFSNKVFGRSIDVDVVDSVAIIPDILLQTDKDLTAWAFVGTAENGYTKISKVFKVNKRNKPADYVFTPPEQTSLEEILEKIDYLESIQDPDAIKNAVEDYLQNNPIHVDEKDPTVPAWAKQPEKPKYTATEVGALPDTAKIPSKTSELKNDSGFVNNTVTNLVNYYLKTETYSKEEVRQLISAIPKFSIKPVSKLPTADISETTIYLLPGGDGDDLYTEYIYVSGRWEILGSQKMDLTGYATETYVKDYSQPKGNYLTEVPKGYATEQFVKEQIAEAELGGEEVDLSGYALKSELPTKTSQLVNDSGYLNSVPEGYAKTEDIPTKPQDIGAQPAGDYALKSDIPSVPVQSVNGKTGAVNLSAPDVGARPDSWMPTAQEVGALTESALGGAVNNALAQAKASGEFDGADGTSVTVKSVSESSADGGNNVVTFSDGKTVTIKNGSKGSTGGNGADGVSPTVAVSKTGKVTTVSITDANGTKTAIINDGSDGQSGKDGTSVSHSWSGTTLSVTSASGTSSANLKGEKGDKGDKGDSVKGDTGVGISSVKQTTTSTADDGNNVITVTLTNGTTSTFTVQNGSKGSSGSNGKDGADGKTPVKGTDYFTAADKTEMVNSVLAALPTWTGGSY